MSEHEHPRSPGVTIQAPSLGVTSAPSLAPDGGLAGVLGVDGAGGVRPHRHRRRVVAVALATVVAAGVVVAIVDPFHSNAASSSNHVATSLATVVRRSLSQQTQVNATLGFAGSYSVVNQAQGTLTDLPAVGAVVSEGQVLYEVNGVPVVLLYGTTPAYRTLAEGASASDVTGADVEELNAALVALGYATSAQLSPTSNEFGAATKTALEALQGHLGMTQTGTLELGQAVFLPSAARVTTVTGTLGAPAQPGQSVMTATSTSRQVTIALDASLQADVKVGDPVTITLPNNATTPGVVSAIGTVATSSSDNNGSGSPPTVSVYVTPTNPSATGSYDQAPVEVSITNNSVADALVVPVNTLLALASGGYALEVVPARGPHYLLAVTTGLFDDADGLVQVSGAGLVPGMRVVQPSS
jgi:hypothetical protein